MDQVSTGRRLGKSVGRHTFTLADPVLEWNLSPGLSQVRPERLMGVVALAVKL